jgi:hypothetical protein
MPELELPTRARPQCPYVADAEFGNVTCVRDEGHDGRHRPDRIVRAFKQPYSRWHVTEQSRKVARWNSDEQ